MPDDPTTPSVHSTQIRLSDDEQATIVTITTTCPEGSGDPCRERHIRAVDAVLAAFPGSSIIPE